MEEDGFRLCLVCTAHSDSAHFGVDCCRACAAFFRRSVTLKKKYICRTATGTCTVHKDNRFTCRNCRYKKCVAVGMLPENVHSRIFNLQGSAESEDSSPGPSRRVLVKTEADSSWHSNSPIQLHLLAKIEHQYRINVANRRKTEHSALQTARGETEMPTMIPDEYSEEPLPTTQQGLNVMAKAIIPEYQRFACECYGEQFTTLGVEEQSTIIKHYVIACFVFENFYRTQQLFPGRDDIFMLSATRYVQFDDLEGFCDEIPDAEKAKAAKLMKTNLQEGVFKAIQGVMENAAITETEFIAILGLLFWPAYMVGMKEGILNIALKQRAQIFQELSLHYRDEMMGEDTALRLGNIGAVLLCVQGVTGRIREDMEVYSLLNIFEKETPVYRLVNAWTNAEESM